MGMQRKRGADSPFTRRQQIINLLVSLVVAFAVIMLAAVAVRIERLKLLSRKEPERPASDEFSPTELQAIVLLRFGNKARRQVPEGTVPTIKQAVQWLAEIGGYTGKSSGGPPGSVTIGRGLREVLVAARVLAATQATCD